MKNTINGFTLAEVLITLVIIGVIAAITIPTLMNKTNKQEYVVKLKKAYSTLSQATNRIIAENGTPKESLGGWLTSHEALYNMYAKYLSNAKRCDVGQTCFSYITYKNQDGTNSSYKFMKYEDTGELVLADGTFVQFNAGTDCAIGKRADEFKTVSAHLHVDVNGAKGPNMWGVDAFRFYLNENGLFPTGCWYNSTNCDGQNCTCTVLREGAMNY